MRVIKSVGGHSYTGDHRSKSPFYSLVEVWWDGRNANIAITTMVLEVGAYVVDEVVKVGVHILR